MKTYLITGTVLTGLMWAGLSWWAATLPDPITAWGFGLIGTIGLWIVLAFLLIPVEYDPNVIVWPEPPQQRGPTQAELDAQHQRHLAEQARYLYLAGENTPPTDWYPR